MKVSTRATARALWAVALLSVAACTGERAYSARNPATGSGGAGGGPGMDGGGAQDGGTDGDGSVDLPQRPDGPAPNGNYCVDGTDCTSGICVDRTCCDKACAGTCMTCASPASPGTCTVADPGTDPRHECMDQGVASCGISGSCNGMGACRVYTAGTVCDSTPVCDTSGGSTILTHVCNGTGACILGPAKSCGGYKCSAGVCGNKCSGDGDCASGSICTASTCLSTVNLAGNGDLETGTLTNWTMLASGSIGISDTTAGGVSHMGQYSIVDTGRGQYYEGPEYPIATGPGKYTISVWGMQKDDATATGVLQLTLTCATTMQYITVQANGAFGIAMNQGVWTMFGATVDTSTAPADCQPTATPPGLVRAAAIYLNQTMTPTLTPVAYPDLYMDDMVVQVPDAHNLVGNPNFEAGATDGWNVTGSSSLSVSTAVAHGGTHSLWQNGRSVTTAGPRYVLPTGAARYNVSFYVQHSGVSTHDLVLGATYTCLGGNQTFAPAIATVSAVPGNTWTLLNGTVTMPPPSAPTGCQLSEAGVFVEQESGTCGTNTGQVECPDLFVDDASVSMAP
jgi:hypothetical protein